MKSRKNTWIAGAALVVVGVMLVCTGPLEAGPIATDTRAMVGFYGTRSFSHSGGGETLTADVDYAVYAPADYPGDDPSAEADYVYVYQIFNDPTSTVGVAFFSVGLEDGSGADHAGDDTSAGAPGATVGQSQSLEMVGTTSVYWLFDLNIAPAAWSTTLLFTSSNAPTWKSGALADGGLPTPGSDLLPSPTPEPVTIALMATGLALVGIGRARRRR